MRSFATFVSSIARGLCLRDASTNFTILFAVYFVFSTSLAGCGGGGGTGGSVQQSTQTITFTPPTSPITYAPGLTVSLSATGGGSGNAVVFSVDATSTGKGTVSGNTLTVTGAGKLVIDANQAGNSNYYAANQVQATVVVNQAAPTVSAWPTASAITSGQTLASSTLAGGTASVPGAFAWVTPTTVPATGTASESVIFTPTDATDYTAVSADVSVIVNPATPQIIALTPRYIVSDNYLYNLSSTPTYTFTCSGCQNGDITHDASGMLSDLTSLSLPPGGTNFGINVQWQPGTYQPWFLTFEMQHPGGAYGNQYSSAFFGSASQSTLVASPTTSRLFQVEQSTGQIYWQDTNGAKGTLFPSGISGSSPVLIAVDDASGNVVRADTGAITSASWIEVDDQNGGYVCSLNNTGMSFISSLAARGGYMVFTDPIENLVGIAKMDCTGYKTVPVAGQPWSVAMTNNGTETDANVLARDAWSPDGHPGVIKFVVPAMTIEGSVELSNVPAISSIRATTPQEGVDTIVALTGTTKAAVLSMSNSTDGKVSLISTDTSSGKAMSVTDTVSVPELPFGLATQENASASMVWVVSITAAGGDNVTHAGTIDPTTGNYTPNVKSCPAGILAGGFAFTSAQGYCAQGSVIAPLQ
jgi:hypothetical protein